MTKKQHADQPPAVEPRLPTKGPAEPRLPTKGPAEPRLPTKVTAEPAVVPSTVTPAEKKKTPWFRFTVMILFGLVYAWDLFSALSNFFGVQADVSRMNTVRADNNFSLIDTPWVPLMVNLVVPLAVFGLALWISRRRSVGILAIMLFAGLGVVAAVSLSLAAYVRAILPPF